MSDLSDKYGEALAEYAEAVDNARQLAQKISAINQAVNFRFGTFMECEYGATFGAHRGRDPQIPPLSDWPDGQTLDASFGALARAFVAVREAWSAIPDGQKAHLAKPPGAILLKQG